MAQFDVHRNRDANTSTVYPYLLDLQHDMLSDLTTRVVAPLILSSKVERSFTRLTPSFEIEGEGVTLSTPELAGVAGSVLGDRVVSLSSRRDEIIAALDLLFTGI